MDRIDFSNLGGFPFSATRADFLQQNYLKAFAAIAAFIGEKVIITGVTVNGGNVSDGWIIYNGEIIKFTGGALSDGVVIQEASTAFNFQNGANYPIVFTKTATCGLPATFNFSDFVRLDTIANVFQAFSKFVNAFKTSDDPTLNDSATLATTKATANLQTQINGFKGVVYSGTVHVGDLANNGQGYDATQLQLLQPSNNWVSNFKLTFPAGFTMNDPNYLVILQIKNNGFNTAAQFNTNLGIATFVGQKLTTGFYFSTSISASNDPGIQDIYLDYFLIKI